MSIASPAAAPVRIDESASVSDLVRLCRRQRLGERETAALLSHSAVDIRKRVAVLAQLTGRDYA